VQPGHYEFDIGTAGASTLVMQTVLLPLALADAPSRVVVEGGTHVPHAPTAQYLMHVYGDVLKECGLDVAFDSPAAGFFPRGGGRVEAEIGASTLQPVDLVERGRLRGLTVYVVTSGLPSHVAERGASTAEKALSGFRKPRIVALDLPSRGQGASVVVVAECENVRAGFSSIGERGKPMERVVEDACREFADWYRTGAACDEHLADQLVLPMALTRSTSRWSTSTVSEHLRTVLWVVEKFLPVSTSIEERVDGSGLVTVEPSY
jgi:RNA 3'-terminal phosphate cyclase (ATP)